MDITDQIGLFIQQNKLFKQGNCGISLSPRVSLYISIVGAQRATIDCGDISWLDIDTSKALESEFLNITISDMKLINTFNDEVGGAITVSGPVEALLIVDNMIFETSDCEAGGGFIYSQYDIQVSASSFDTATALGNGGAILTPKSITIHSSTIHNTKASNAGGALHAPIIKVMSSRISNCSAVDGGAIFGETAFIFFSDFFDNRATSKGGVGYLKDGSLQIGSVSFQSSFADMGAALYLFNMSGEATTSNFTGNHADSYGGAIVLDTSTDIDFLDSTFYENTALLNVGGAFYIAGDQAGANIYNGQLWDNSLPMGWYKYDPDYDVELQEEIKTLKGQPPKAVECTKDSILDDIASLVKGGQPGGSFYVHASRVKVTLPVIKVGGGIGQLHYPVEYETVREIIDQFAVRAPYGKGAETVLDTKVRKVWQIDPLAISFTATWQKTLDTSILPNIRQGLGLKDDDFTIEATLYKMLIYDKGGFFLPHRDSEKEPRMFATLVISLPCEHTGGRLIISHDGQQVDLNLENSTEDTINYAAFYADCKHEVTKVTSGHRICLVYNILRSTKKVAKTTKAKVVQDTLPMIADKVANILEQVFTTSAVCAVPPKKIVYMLQHKYTTAEMSFKTLKLADAHAAKILQMAAVAKHPCTLSLGMVEIEEEGDCYVSDVSEATVHLQDLISSSGEKIPVKSMALDSLTELFPSNCVNNLVPCQESIEPTGNEGTHYERTYRQAALIIWPVDNYLSLILGSMRWNDALDYVSHEFTSKMDTKETLHHLEKLLDKYKVAGQVPKPKYNQRHGSWTTEFAEKDLHMPVFALTELIKLKKVGQPLLAGYIQEMAGKYTGKECIFDTYIGLVAPHLTDEAIEELFTRLANNEKVSLQEGLEYIEWMKKSTTKKLVNKISFYVGRLMVAQMEKKPKEAPKSSSHYGYRSSSSSTSSTQPDPLHQLVELYQLWEQGYLSGRMQANVVDPFLKWAMTVDAKCSSADATKYLDLITTKQYPFPAKSFVNVLLKDSKSTSNIIQLAPHLSSISIQEHIIKSARSGDLVAPETYKLIIDMRANPKVFGVDIVNRYAKILADRIAESNTDIVSVLADRLVMLWSQMVDMGTPQEALVSRLLAMANSNTLDNMLAVSNKLVAIGKGDFKMMAGIDKGYWQVWTQVANYFTKLDEEAIVLKNWSIVAREICTKACQDCKDLIKFVEDGKKLDFSLKALKANRTHLEKELTAKYPTQLIWRTLTGGSPQTLVVNKIQDKMYLGPVYKQINGCIQPLYTVGLEHGKSFASVSELLPRMLARKTPKTPSTYPAPVPLEKIKAPSAKKAAGAITDVVMKPSGQVQQRVEVPLQQPVVSQPPAKPLVQTQLQFVLPPQPPVIQAPLPTPAAEVDDSFTFDFDDVDDVVMPPAVQIRPPRPKQTARKSMAREWTVQDYLDEKALYEQLARQKQAASKNYFGMDMDDSDDEMDGSNLYYDDLPDTDDSYSCFDDDEDSPVVYYDSPELEYDVVAPARPKQTARKYPAQIKPYMDDSDEEMDRSIVYDDLRDMVFDVVEPPQPLPAKPKATRTKKAAAQKPVMEASTPMMPEAALVKPKAVRAKKVAAVADPTTTTIPTSDVPPPAKPRASRSKKAAATVVPVSTAPINPLLPVDDPTTTTTSDVPPPAKPRATRSKKTAATTVATVVPVATAPVNPLLPVAEPIPVTKPKAARTKKVAATTVATVAPATTEPTCVLMSMADYEPKPAKPKATRTKKAAASIPVMDASTPMMPEAALVKPKAVRTKKDTTPVPDPTTTTSDTSTIPAPPAKPRATRTKKAAAATVAVAPPPTQEGLLLAQCFEEIKELKKLLLAQTK
eukprot:gene17114-20385_t